MEDYLARLAREESEAMHKEAEERAFKREELIHASRVAKRVAARAAAEAAALGA
jgi:hypothetical protein